MLFRQAPSTVKGKDARGFCRRWTSMSWHTQTECKRRDSKSATTPQNCNHLKSFLTLIPLIMIWFHREESDHNYINSHDGVQATRSPVLFQILAEIIPMFLQPSLTHTLTSHAQGLSLVHGILYDLANLNLPPHRLLVAGPVQSSAVAGKQGTSRLGHPVKRDQLGHWVLWWQIPK